MPKNLSDEEYKNYRQSEHWQGVRRLALNRAGFRCERIFHPQGLDEVGDLPPPARCNGVDKLQVHHKTYDRLGKERLEDVEVVCDRCHLLEHLLQQRCLRCGEPVFGEEEAAMSFIDNKGYMVNEDGRPDLQALRDNSPTLCDWCDHMAQKDE